MYVCCLCRYRFRTRISASAFIVHVWLFCLSERIMHGGSIPWRDPGLNAHLEQLGLLLDMCANGSPPSACVSRSCFTVSHSYYILFYLFVNMLDFASLGTVGYLLDMCSYVLGYDIWENDDQYQCLSYTWTLSIKTKDLSYSHVHTAIKPYFLSNGESRVPCMALV